MYADDTNVTFAASDMLGLETQINTELKSINLWLRANKLSLNVAKTEFMVISSRQKLQSLNDKTININVEGVKINQTDNSKAASRTEHRRKPILEGARTRNFKKSRFQYRCT